MPITASLIAAGIGAAGQSAFGLYQINKANQLAKNNTLPQYSIPDEIRQKLSNSQIQALEGLPAEQKQQFINNLQRSTNFGISALNERGSGIAGISQLVQSQDDSYNKLLGEDAAARQRNQAILGATQSEVAGYKDKAFEINKLDPYNKAFQASQNLLGTGVNNIHSGITGATNAASLYSLSNGGQGQKSGFGNLTNDEYDILKKQTAYVPGENIDENYNETIG